MTVCHPKIIMQSGEIMPTLCSWDDNYVEADASHEDQASFHKLDA